MCKETLKEIVKNMQSIVKEKIIAIYIYGSVARKENDENSDCDVLVCVNNCKQDEYNLIKKYFLACSPNDKYEFSFYTIEVLEEMQKKGSYFLWHIKKEGVLVYQNSNKIYDLLDKLPLYKGTHEDLCEYEEILNDIEESVKEDEITIVYELSVLATLARNICIACCYLIGDMDFGRNSPIIKCIKFFEKKFPFSLEEYISLYKFRLHCNRNTEIEHKVNLAEFAQNWILRVRSLLEIVLNIEEEKNDETE